MMQSNIIMYTTKDGIIKIEEIFDYGMIWISIDKIAELF